MPPLPVFAWAEDTIQLEAMSTRPAKEPTCIPTAGGAVELVIDARPRDIGGFSVRRTLPSHVRRTVGPFIFFDHMGPAALDPGEGIDVRPHPHIGLATVTYLFEGEIVHRDSLGSEVAIVPGDVNFMMAGKGIVHSERTGAEQRRRGPRVHGIQSWLALPVVQEEGEPRFEHHAEAKIPGVSRGGGAELRIILGQAFDAKSPVSTLAPTFYVEARLEAGAELWVPDEYAERAAYVVSGAVREGDQRFAEGTMMVFRTGADVCLRAQSATRVMLLGGAPLDGPRFIWWNFVSSSKERMERAKRDWREQRFPKVPGDSEEFIPLPDT
jgi:redox-sensitive bicupin YhaK (pirin superfamily)